MNAGIRRTKYGFVSMFLFITILMAGAAGEAEDKTPRKPISLIVSETPDTLTCLNADGTTITLTKHPKRTVINYTSLVGLWYQAGGVAVGMPETSNLAALPAAARTIETTGHTTSPNIEKVLALEPDLVIIESNKEKQRAMGEILADAGSEVLILNYENYGDYLGILDLFYRLNGKDLASDDGVEITQKTIEDLIGKTMAKQPVKFLSLFASTRTVQAETDRAHTAFIASSLGGRNITAAGVPTPGQIRLPFSIERVHMEDPDVIFVTTMGDGDKIREKMRQDFMESDIWKGLRAVQTGRVFFLPNELFLYKPADRFPEAFEHIAALLFPAGI